MNRRESCCLWGHRPQGDGSLGHVSLSPSPPHHTQTHLKSIMKLESQSLPIPVAVCDPDTHTLCKCVLSTTTLLANLTGQGWLMDPSSHTADTTQTGFPQTLGVGSLKMTAHDPETHPES